MMSKCVSNNYGDHNFNFVAPLNMMKRIQRAGTLASCARLVVGQANAKLEEVEEHWRSTDAHARV